MRQSVREVIGGFRWEKSAERERLLESYRLASIVMAPRVMTTRGEFFFTFGPNIGIIGLY